MPGNSDRSINSGMEKIQTTTAKIERKGKCISKPCCNLGCPVQWQSAGFLSLFIGLHNLIISH